MKVIRYIKPLAVFYFLLTYAMLYGQGWEKTYGESASDVFNDLIQTDDNGWLTVGSSSSFGTGDRDVYLVKSDVDGTEQWHRYFRTTDEDLGNALDIQFDGTIIIAGASGSTAATTGMVWKTDPQGNLLWTFQTTQDSIILRDIAQSPDGNIVAAGSNGNRIFILKIDNNGNQLWSKTLVANDIENAFEIEMLEDNSFIIAGYSHDSSASVNSYLAKIDSNGTVIWEKNYGNPLNEEQALCITPNQNNGYFIAGFSDGATTADKGVWIAEVDSLGNEIFKKTILIEGTEKCRSITQLATGELILAGDIVTLNGNVDGLLIKATNTGDRIWSRTYGGLNTEILTAVKTFNDNLFVAGTTSSFGAGSFDGWLLRTDNNGNSFGYVLKGNVYDDLNLNCLSDSGELGIENWLIEVKGTREFYANTDANGDFEILVGADDYIVNVIAPNPYWTPCTNGLAASFTNLGDTVVLDFPIQKTSTCPYMTIDVSTPFLRRCFPNAYTVNYCNTGTQTATNATISIDFDEFLTIDSSEVTLASLGNNQFEFQVSQLAPFECGSFKVYTTVDCNTATLGQTHCTTASITPDTFCIQPNPSWDGTSLEVDGYCASDSIYIQVTNTAPTAMSNASDFIIIEDELLTRQGPIKLDGNQDTTFVLETTGETIRFEIEQPIGHPGNSKPSIAIEGCGGSPFSLGFVTQFSQDDGNHFVEIDCQENIGSYDPNDKRGFPKGYGPDLLIENETELEYIIRFQNTGTDTAFTVVIRDTLRAELNPSTIKLGASSHPYSFEIYENSVIKFTFSDILLVDSFTNEPASHGFVKFKIKPDDGLYFYTEINNSADIYFDFNPPVITNETIHRISTNFVIADTTSSVFNPKLPKVAVTIAPNPFSNKTQIELHGSDSNEHSFQLFNAFGQLIRTEDFIGSKYIFSRKMLPKGIYFFNIKNKKNQLISSGKMIFN